MKLAKKVYLPGSGYEWSKYTTVLVYYFHIPLGKNSLKRYVEADCQGSKLIFTCGTQDF